MISRNSTDLFEYNQLLCDESKEESMIHFKHAFSYIDNEKQIIENLEKNRLISNFKILKNVNMRWTFYVKKDSLPMIMEENTSMTRKILKKFKTQFQTSKKIQEESDLMKLNGEVSLAWSTDAWKTWYSIKAVYSHETNRFLVYEKTLNNVDKLFHIGQALEFVSCYIDCKFISKSTNKFIS
jgi:hypothetical protein